MIHEVKDIIKKYESLYERLDKSFRDSNAKKFNETGKLSELNIPAELDYIIAQECGNYSQIGEDARDRLQNAKNAALALIIFTKNMNGIF